jgi:shikimate kinase / 3-dehydroquinate synthase
VVGRDVGALGKHLVLIGFMGAGKTTVGRDVAHRIERPFIDLDQVIEDAHGSIPELFEQGEGQFRALERSLAEDVLRTREPSVIALGGGAVESTETRDLLRRSAFTVHIRIGVDTAWERARDSGRPLARDEREFRRLYQVRQAVYTATADAAADDAPDTVRSSLGIRVGPRGVLSAGALVADERVLDLHPLDLGCPVLRVPPGEPAKHGEVVRRLWNGLELGRDERLLAYGGGTTTDVAGFVAATYLRGVRWTALPTTLVGQVDAAIGGKTGIDLELGKNLVGVFHYPEAVVCDPSFLATLPPEERRAGMAEVVKTGLLAGEPFWELEDEAMVRECAAYKAAVCLSDPFEETGRRAVLNLGHTFAHALEAAAGFQLRHGDAVALGLRAALRLSGQSTDVVDEVLAPEAVDVDLDAAWEAMRRDKKNRGGRIRLVLLAEPGRPVFPAELPEAEVRAALSELLRS